MPSNDIVPVAPRFGLLRSPKRITNCSVQCDLPKPSFWSFVLQLFGVSLLKRGDFWRCSDCGKVYRFRQYPRDTVAGDHVKNCVHGCNVFCSYWVRVPLDEWKAAGGIE